MCSQRPWPGCGWRALELGPCRLLPRRVSGRGLGQPPPALWHPTKASPPTRLRLCVPACRHHWPPPMPTTFLRPPGDYDRGADSLTGAGGAQGTCTLPLTHTCTPPTHTQRTHQAWGHATPAWIGHTRTGERWAWGGSRRACWLTFIWILSLGLCCEASRGRKRLPARLPKPGGRSHGASPGFFQHKGETALHWC